MNQIGLSAIMTLGVLVTTFWVPGDVLSLEKVQMATFIKMIFLKLIYFYFFTIHKCIDGLPTTRFGSQKDNYK